MIYTTFPTLTKVCTLLPLVLWHNLLMFPKRVKLCATVINHFPFYLMYKMFKLFAFQLRQNMTMGFHYFSLSLSHSLSLTQTVHTQTHTRFIFHKTCFEKGFKIKGLDSSPVGEIVMLIQRYFKETYFWVSVRSDTNLDFYRTSKTSKTWLHLKFLVI